VKVVRSAAELASPWRRACLAIGMFDGVHLGHQQVIRQAVADAEHCEGTAVAVTFDRHPNAVVAPDRVPPLIYSLPQRLRAIGSLRMEAAWLITFEKAFSTRTGEQFVRDLVRDFGNISSICVGADFHFGFKRSGNIQLLKELGRELGFLVHGLASVALDGETVSSTRIRDAIRKGELSFASQMLGRDYALVGKVVRGDGFGRQIDFPTANIDTSGLVLPPTGVYAVHVRADSQEYRAALNIGCRPTLQIPTAQTRVEVHLLDFSGDLYDRELEITFVEKLRDEMKFPSVGDLRAQIGRDVAETREIFARLAK
jgi:riboflavin kinase/FMN adenylyltransferase